MNGFKKQLRQRFVQKNTNRNMNYQAYYPSPIGLIGISSCQCSITTIDFVEQKQIQEDKNHIPEVVRQAVRELDEYFLGKRKKFTVPFHQEGTPFQLSVWQALTTIPYGYTKSYFDISSQINNSKAVRAVGMTNSKNPIAIIVPCHRVIGKNGKMVGYASGIWRKEWLLAHEKKHVTSKKT